MVYEEKTVPFGIKVIGLLKATRPHFLLAYTIFGGGGIIIGLAQGKIISNITYLVIAYFTIILAAIGIHFRDEAVDWRNGYDLEHGSVGVIREGILSEKFLMILGIILSIISVGSIIAQIILHPWMLLPGIPSFLMIIGANFLTEKVPLGHELVTALSYWGVILWMYLSQGWVLNLSVILFSIFGYFVALAFIAYQDIGDYKVDKKNGKKTLTVLLGIDRIGLVSIGIGLIALIILFACFMVWP